VRRPRAMLQGSCVQSCCGGLCPLEVCAGALLGDNGGNATQQLRACLPWRLGKGGEGRERGGGGDQERGCAEEHVGMAFGKGWRREGGQERGCPPHMLPMQCDGLMGRCITASARARSCGWPLSMHR
jgi:hypothetical protein